MIKVLLAEEVHMVRGAFIALLTRENDIDVVAELGDGSKILPMARLHRPDVAVIDIDMPGQDDLMTIEQVHAELPKTQALILTHRWRPATVRRALNMGVGGFLLKDSPPENLVSAVRELADGRRVIDADLAVSAWKAPAPPLTDREMEVLRLAAEGEGVTEIAARLHLSPGTIRNYLTTVATKLNARTRVDAVRIAVDAGWL
ncbi:response regulator transcription factor [Streptomyces sp. NPDC002285]|uniref:response regulator transcription factor n=1 Tax=unclassified Streptomyces TaxID=2593676 RepID=UPI0036B34781